MMASDRDEDKWVTITRTESNRTDPYITIIIRNGDVDTQAEMSLADFALVVTGMGRVPAKVVSRPFPRRRAEATRAERDDDDAR